MNTLSRRINSVVNLSILLVVILIGIVFVRSYLFAHHPTPMTQDYRIPAGTRVSLPGIDWAKNSRTLLLVLQKGCHFCTESAPFYRQLVHETATKSTVRLYAVLPQEITESKRYLSSISVPIDEVRQSELGALGVQGTPTLILVNGKGEVVESWVGKLPTDKEMDVLKQIEEKKNGS